MKESIRWTDSLLLEKGGHRIFREDRGPYVAPELCRWAIADNSGARPDTTDDGILWLLTTEPLIVNVSDIAVVSIPVVKDRCSFDCWVPAGVGALATLRKKFPQWPVHLSPKARVLHDALLGATFDDLIAAKTG